jgi:hypothetical protein
MCTSKTHMASRSFVFCGEPGEHQERLMQKAVCEAILRDKRVFVAMDSIEVQMRCATRVHEIAGPGAVLVLNSRRSVAQNAEAVEAVERMGEIRPMPECVSNTGSEADTPPADTQVRAVLSVATIVDDCAFRFEQSAPNVIDCVMGYFCGHSQALLAKQSLFQVARPRNPQRRVWCPEDSGEPLPALLTTTAALLATGKPRFIEMLSPPVEGSLIFNHETRRLERAPAPPLVPVPIDPCLIRTLADLHREEGISRVAFRSALFGRLAATGAHVFCATP